MTNHYRLLPHEDFELIRDALLACYCPARYPLEKTEEL